MHCISFQNVYDVFLWHKWFCHLQTVLLHSHFWICHIHLSFPNEISFCRHHQPISRIPSIDVGHALSIDARLFDSCCWLKRFIDPLAIAKISVISSMETCRICPFIARSWPSRSMKYQTHLVWDNHVLHHPDIWFCLVMNIGRWIVVAFDRWFVFAVDRSLFWSHGNSRKHRLLPWQGHGTQCSPLLCSLRRIHLTAAEV